MSELAVYLLGTPRIEREGRPLLIERQKAVALLAYLVVTERAHSRDWLAALLWPDVETSRAQLRIALSLLRQRLGTDYFDTTRGDIGLRREVIWSDVGRLRAICAADASTQANERFTLVDEAARLYQYDFMAGFTLPDAPNYDSWQWAEEQKLRSGFETLLTQHITALTAQGNLTTALPYVQRLAALDPFNERYRRQLISLYLDTNQRHNALMEYQSTLDALMNKLGVQPEAETRALYDRIQASLSAPTELTNTPPAYALLPAREPLIGRDAELALLAQVAASGERLMTISGPSGIGKTHLAVALGHRLSDTYRDGAFFLTFSTPVTSSGLVAALARIFQMPPLPFGDRLDSLLVSLQTKNCLIILDNLELIENAQRVLQTLLETAPRVGILVTAHDILHLKQEYCYPLKGLDILQRNDVSGASQLFIHTAQHINPSISFAATSLTAIERICQLTQGMPLAIILAASWCDVLPPDEIAQEIEANYDFLHVNYLDVPERHRSIRAVFDAIWSRLNADEQRALLRLSVFRGGFSRRAAEQVSKVPIALLKALATKSLISFQATEQRYVLHDLLRQYAHERFEADELRAAQAAHCTFFADYAAQREKAIASHSQTIVWHDLNAELANLRAAWAFALESENFAALIRMIEPMRLFFHIGGTWEQGVLLFEQARRVTAASEGEAAWAHVKLLSRLYLDDDQIAERLTHALQSAIQRGDEAEVAHIHTELGWRSLMQTAYREAETYFRHALAFYQRQHDGYALALLHKGLAYCAIVRFERDSAQRHMQTSLKLRRATGDRVGETEMLVLRGELHLMAGDLRAAEQDLRSAYTFLADAFGKQSALLRVIALGWSQTLLCEWGVAEQFAEDLAALSLERSFVIARMSALAMRLMIHTLNGNSQSLDEALERFETSLTEIPPWPSTINSDLAFLAEVAHFYGAVRAGAVGQTLHVLALLEQRGSLIHPAHNHWLIPGILQVAAAVGGIDTEPALIRARQSGMMAQAWVKAWFANSQQPPLNPTPEQAAALRSFAQTVINA